MNRRSTNPDVRAYLAAIEARLGDLSADERRDLLDELEVNLTETAAETDGSLNERLGPPDRYVAELRASAGLEQRVPQEPHRPAPIVRAWRSAPVVFMRRFQVFAVLGTVLVLALFGAFGGGGDFPGEPVMVERTGVIPKLLPNRVAVVCLYDEDGRLIDDRFGRKTGSLRRKVASMSFSSDGDVDDMPMPPAIILRKLDAAARIADAEPYECASRLKAKN